MAKTKKLSIKDAKITARAQMYATVGQDRESRKADLAERVLRLTEDAQFVARMSDSLESDSHHDLRKVVERIESVNTWIDHKGRIKVRKASKAQKLQMELAVKRAHRAGTWSNQALDVAKKASSLLE